MKKYFRFLAGFTVTIIALLSGIVVIVYFILQSYIPDYEGKFSLNGLKENVGISRDNNGVAYINALNEEDAIFALGFAHAQERMFQMDVIRRAGEGRLSEIFGNKTSGFDRMFRTIGLAEVVKKTLPELNPKSKTLLQAYSDGVNSYLQTKKNYSVEFDLLGYQPEEWHPENSLLVAKLMAWELNISWWSDIAFSSLVQLLGEEKAAEILPKFDENFPTIIPENLMKFSSLETGLISLDKNFREFMGISGTHIGSNSWVVSRNKSGSGMPILANDPHLAFSVPGKWYVAVLRGGEYRCEGFTLPGVPGVVIGKNQKIAWGLTNVMADDADFYVERFDSSNTKYLFNGNWEELIVRQDTIKVKDSSDVIFTIRKTHRGPVVSDIHSYDILFPDSITERENISMRWTALEISDELFAIYSVNTAGNWQQFNEALRHFTVPGQNFIYADTEGNIGYVCAAKLPKRKSNSPTLVFDGTTDQSDWKGFVPYDEMPKLFNPPADFISSANNKTVKNFTYHISNIWEPPSRIERINELLLGKQRHSVDDFRKYQVDFESKFASEIIPFVLNAFSGAKVNDSNLKTSLELFRKWDFVMDKYSQTPAVFLMFFQKLLKNIFLDEMGEKIFNEYLFIANIPYRMIPEMLNGNNSSWFDNIKTQAKETRDDIIRASLVEAISELEILFGKNLAEWQWMKLHKLTFKHPFDGASPLSDRIFNIGEFAIGGDGTTIFNTEYSFTKPFETKLGPSMRFIFDFADRDHIYFILPTGQSGHFFSENYRDLTGAWMDGQMIKLCLDINQVEKSVLKTLELIPSAVN